MTFNKIPLALGFNSSTGNASGLVEFTLDLSNVGGVCEATPTNGQVLTWSGATDGEWCPSTVATGGGGGGGTTIPNGDDPNDILAWGTSWQPSTALELGLATTAALTTTTNTANAALARDGGAMTGAITTNSTFDNVEVAVRDGVLTTTTNTANAALPLSGGAMTGAITTNSTFDGRDVAADGIILDGIAANLALQHIAGNPINSTNSTSKTLLNTVSLPADTLASATTVRITYTGTVNGNGNAVYFYLDAGGDPGDIAILESNSTFDDSAPDQAFTMIVEIIGIATDRQLVTQNFKSSTPTAAAAGVGGIGSVGKSGFAYNSLTLDDSLSQTLKLSSKLGSSTSGLVSIDDVLVEKIGPLA